MVWLGSGDLVGSAVSGGNYGYALMWGLTIALLARFFVVSALAKYQLCNSQGDTTILHGYARLWRGFPLLLAGGALILGFTYNAFLLRGAATALFNLFGRTGGASWGIFVWALVSIIASLYLVTRPNQYKGLEWIANAAIVSLAGTFLIALVGTGFSPVEFLKGMTFRIPPDEGPIGALLVVIALIGTVGGSAANLLYTYFMSEKGWQGPGFRKLQIYDLLLGVASIVVINIAVWVVAAETLRGSDLTISGEADLESMMELALGPIGGVLLWIGLFGATFDALPANAFGYTKMFIGAVHQTFRHRSERFDRPESDPLFKWIQIGALLVLPLVFSLPFAPDFVILTLVGNALAVVLVPVIIVGLIWITNKKELLLPGYANSWWENAILLLVGAIGVWGTYSLIQSLVDLIAQL
jgi:hypothetical protein